MSINIAAAIQNQMLTTLLQALQSADQPLKAGAVVEAQFMAWSDDATGSQPGQGKAAHVESARGKAALSQALIQIAGRPTTLLIEATPERRALMQPGATLTLHVDAVASENSPARMRLLAIQTPQVSAGHTGQAAALAPDQSLAVAPRLGRSGAQTAREIAGPLIGAALARQNGLGAAFADIEALVKAPSPLPSKVRDAAVRLLALRPDAATLADEPDMLKAAVGSSGLFHETLLAKGAPEAAADDLKGALIALKQALKKALGSPITSEQHALLARPEQQEMKAATKLADTGNPARPQAPTRDSLPVPQGMLEPSIDPVRDSPVTMMTRVLERTEGALDRLSISQFASLPTGVDTAQGAPSNRWFTELPLVLDGRTAVLPLDIEEDHGGSSRSGPQAKLWRVRFALDIEPMGPLHAMVTMQGRSIGVTVWAERDSTTQLVRDHAADLKAALLDHDFDNPQIDVLAGQPMRRPAPAGHYLDRRS